MLLLDAELPTDWAGDACVVLTVRARVAGAPTDADPIEVRVTPTVRHVGGSDVALIGQLPLLLGFDVGALAGRVVTIHATAQSAVRVATEDLSVTLRQR